MMRKRGNNGNRNNKEKQLSPAALSSLKDGQTVVLAVRDPMLASGANIAAAAAAASSNGSAVTQTLSPENKLSSDEAALTAKNYRMAKELVRFFCLP